MSIVCVYNLAAYESGCDRNGPQSPSKRHFVSQEQNEMPDIFYTTLKLVIIAAVFAACYLVNYKRLQIEEEYKQQLGGAGSRASSASRS
jgi:hypothetical protein